MHYTQSNVNLVGWCVLSITAYNIVKTTDFKFKLTLHHTVVLYLTKGMSMTFDFSPLFTTLDNNNNVIIVPVCQEVEARSKEIRYSRPQ